MKWASIFLVLVNSTAWASGTLPSLDPISRKLYEYIKASQYSDQNPAGAKGFWPSSAHLRGLTALEIPDTNSFLTLQSYEHLYELSQYVDLPGVRTIFDQGREKLDQFVEESSLTGEPPGTLNYWLIVRELAGKAFRGPNALIPVEFVPVLNLPNDLDTSADAYKWFRIAGDHLNFQSSYIETISKFVDSDRSVEFPNDLKWKETNSGAFLTWSEKDKVDDGNSRIPQRINDVDCVVNLNTLSAIGAYESSGLPLPVATAEAKSRACAAINRAVTQKNENVCGVYYDRASQFFLAYSKASSAQISCLQSSFGDVIQRLVRDSERIVKLPDSITQWTELSEEVIALKMLVPLSQRTLQEQDLLGQLQAKLRSAVSAKILDSASPLNESLYRGDLSLIHATWYSRPFTAILALKALALP